MPHSAVKTASFSSKIRSNTRVSPLTPQSTQRWRSSQSTGPERHDGTRMGRKKGHQHFLLTARLHAQKTSLHQKTVPNTNQVQSSSRIRIHARKPAAFLYADSEVPEKEAKKTSSCANATERMKHLGITWKDGKTCMLRTGVMFEIGEYDSSSFILSQNGFGHSPLRSHVNFGVHFSMSAKEWLGFRWGSRGLDRVLWVVRTASNAVF